MAKAKFNQSQTITVRRSSISFAPYNPRLKDPKIVEKLKSNFKKVGFMGGIVWNPLTGNLVGGHKRVEAMDLIHGYEGSEETDYDLKVESIELSEKQEMEQNIFLNNKRAQGATDMVKLAEMMEIIEPEAAGLEAYDIEMLEAVVPNFKRGSAAEIFDDMEEARAPKDSPADRIEAVKALKDKMRDNVMQQQAASYFVVTFKNYDDKAEMLEGLGISGDEIYITGERFLKALS